MNHIKAFFLGMQECKSDMTTHFEGTMLNWYDTGRDIARALLLID